MCSDAQIFILTGFSVGAREPATTDSVTGVRKEERREGDTFNGACAPTLPLRSEAGAAPWLPEQSILYLFILYMLHNSDGN